MQMTSNVKYFKSVIVAPSSCTGAWESRIMICPMDQKYNSLAFFFFSYSLFLLFFSFFVLLFYFLFFFFFFIFFSLFYSPFSLVPKTIGPVFPFFCSRLLPFFLFLCLGFSPLGRQAHLAHFPLAEYTCKTPTLYFFLFSYFLLAKVNKISLLFHILSSFIRLTQQRL